MRTDLAGFCDQILSGSINGIYQGVLLVALVALAFRIMGRKTNAATRHAILFFTLLLLTGLMIAHWGRAFSHPRKVSTTNALSSEHFQGEQNLADAVKGRSPDTETGLPVEIYSLAQSEILEVSNNPSLAWGSHEPKDDTSRGEVLSPALEVNKEAAFNQFQNKPFEVLRSIVNRLVNPVSLGLQIPKLFSMVLLAILIAAVVCKLFVLLLHLNGIRRLKTNAALPSRELTLVFERLRQTTRVRRSVQLRVSHSHQSPLLLGFLHPVIFLSAQDQENPDVAEVEQVLHHELAHVRRYDDWVNLVQHLLHSILFFHPGIWWISKRLTLEREIACDDQVLEQSERREYALLLVDLARRMQGNHPALAPGTFSNKNQLKERIDMVLDAYRNTSPRLAKARMGIVTAAIILFAAGAIVCAPRVVLAQNDPAPPAISPPPPPPPVAPPAPRNPGDPFSVAHPAPPGQPGPQPGNPPGPRGPMMRDMLPGERPLEQRLARVERMLEMLMAHFDLNPGEAQFHGNNPAEQRERALLMEKLFREKELAEAERQFKQQKLESAARDEQGRLQDGKALKQEMERLSQVRTQNQLLKLQQHLEMLEREKSKVGQEMERIQKELKEREAQANKSEDKQ